MAVSPRYEPGDLIEEFFREHRAKVQAVCRSLLDDSGEAEDASQQVFLAAFRALAGGTVPRRPEAWLAAIARNECRARAQSRPPVAATNENLENRGADPAALVLERAEVAAVWEAVEDLPPLQREAFLLREVRGLSYKELADDLLLTHPSIRSLLARARRAIRARLSDGAGALGGASWLESLARLLTGGSMPGAIATKTAAVGLGAAAIGGGAIVAPELTPHLRPHRAEAIALHRHAVVAHVRLNRAVRVNPVARAENAPSAPTRHAAAPELVVASPVVRRRRLPIEPAAPVRRPALSPEYAHPLAAAPTTTFASDHESEQPVAPRPASPPTAAPSRPVPHTDGDSKSGHDSGSTGQPGEAEAASGPTVATPAVVPEQATRQAPSNDGEGGRSSRESRNSWPSDTAAQPTTTVAEASAESSNTSPQLTSDGAHQPNGDGSGGD